MMGTKSILFVLLCSSVLWSLVLSVAPNDEDHAQILNKLKNDFKEIRHSNQYAVLYIPPPNARRGQVNYVPRTPQVSTGNVILPELTDNNRNSYEQNYAGATVDFQGAVYGGMLNRQRGRAIHTEDLALNLVFPGMQNWYQTHFQRGINAVYLYSYFLPCPRCLEIIQNFVRDTGVRLYVGYTQLFGGMREGDDQNLQHDTRHRRDTLQNLLNNYNGLLLQVADHGVCDQQGIGSRFVRDTSDICAATDRMLVIVMDFTNGKAQVWFNNFNADYYGRVDLLDKNNNKLTWQYTNGQSSGKITFNSYIQNGAHVQYWMNNQNMIRESYSWNDCGFGFVKLNKLPYLSYLPSYDGFSMIKLTMKDAYPTVLIKKTRYYVPDRRDWVIIQSLDQIGTQNYQTWQWVSRFTREFNYFYFKFSLGSAFAEGFRAKYVFYDSTQYRFEGTYDNASPIWTPGECQSGA